MAKNKIQFQTGYSLFEFLRHYATEAQCRQALMAWRYPNGFVCQECGNKTCCHLRCRPHLLQCHRCHHQTSLTSGTLFACTKLPLTKWFLAMFLLSQSKTGLSALTLKRHIGVSYNTAWALKHKLMQAMKESDDRRTLTGLIQVDDAYWGGQQHGGKRGRGAPGKTPFVAAVELDKEAHPIHMRMTVVSGFTTEAIAQWTRQHVVAGSVVSSDGLSCFRATEAVGNEHQPEVIAGDRELMDEHFKWVNCMIGNVKNSLRGSVHKLGSQHLPRYLAEYCYRFNNRFELQSLVEKLGRDAAQTPPMPYRFLKMAELYG